MCSVVISLAYSLSHTCRYTTKRHNYLQFWKHQFVEHIQPNNTCTGTHTLHAHTCTYLATYAVQDAEISQDSLLNSICITCIFAQGTSAQGCYISLLENHDSVVTNTTGLRIERKGDSLNATGCIVNLEGGLYHVAVYDIEADGTVDWHNRAFFLTAALNWTASDQLNISKSTIIELLEMIMCDNNWPGMLSYHSFMAYAKRFTQFNSCLLGTSYILFTQM